MGSIDPFETWHGTAPDPNSERAHGSCLTTKLLLRGFVTKRRSFERMSTLMSPKVAGLLDRLFAEADRNDPAAFAHFHAETDKLAPAAERL
jgi:hypothetical protein